MPSNEAQVNREIAAEVNRTNYPRAPVAINISDRHHPGIPDIYITGGRWIENKFVKTRLTRSVDVMTKLSPAQQSMAKALTMAGDLVFIGVAWQLQRGFCVYTLCRWEHFEEDHLYDKDRVMQDGYIVSRKDGYGVVEHLGMRAK